MKKRADESRSLLPKSAAARRGGTVPHGVVCLKCDVAVWAGLAVLIGVVYWPLGRYGFILFDDGFYVASNPHVQAGLTWQTMRWAFTTFEQANWHPLTWISHALDCQLFGLNAGLHHLVNVALHIVNSILLYVVLKRMTGAAWRSAIVAALFGLHPLHVESVAWVAERKDVLSTLFGLLALWAYVRYVERPGVWRYVAVVVLFAAALLAKPMLVTLPFLLVLLDYWPLERYVSAARSGSKAGSWNSVRPLLVEKVPLFALSAASCAVTLVAQGGAVHQLPLAMRLGNAASAYVGYLEKMFLPIRLAVFYPYRFNVSSWPSMAYTTSLIGLSAWLIWASKRRPYLVVGWLWYLGTLIPVIGIVQVGAQSMADRYNYLPLVGTFLAIVWCTADFASKLRRGRRLLLAATTVVIIGACTALAAKQVRTWANTETLFRHTLAVTGENHIAHNNLAYVSLQQDKIAEAVEHFQESLRLVPDQPDTLDSLGYIFQQGGRTAEAIEQYEKSLRLRPNQPNTLNNLAWIRATHPDSRFRDGAQAVALAQRAIEISSGEASLLDTLAAALAEAGRFEEAVESEQRAIARSLAMHADRSVATMEQRTGIYAAHRAYRDPALNAVVASKRTVDQGGPAR